MVDSVNNRKRHHTAEPITVARIQDLLRRQEFRCAITGRRLDPSYDGSPSAVAWKPSIDRIDSAQGYSPGNIRIVGYIVNVALADWGVGPVIELAQLLSARSFEALLERDAPEAIRPS